MGNQISNPTEAQKEFMNRMSKELKELLNSKVLKPKIYSFDEVRELLSQQREAIAKEHIDEMGDFIEKERERFLKIGRESEREEIVNTIKKYRDIAKEEGMDCRLLVSEEILDLLTSLIKE